jgi:SRSO17 transposase
MTGSVRMSGASFETTLDLWASSVRAAKARMRPLFRQERTARSAGLFLDGLLGPERRKTGWMRAEAAGDPGPWRQQAVLGRGRWEADALRDVVREYALEELSDRDAVLVVDETGFLKQGKASCGVARQYTGSAGKITNCQIGVFAAYVSRHGHALIDRALYLPKVWANDPARRAAAHIPEAVEFATKPRLALRTIERATAAGVPFAWVAADTVYGVGEVEMALRRAGKGYVLGVTSAHQVYSWNALPVVAGTAEKVAADPPPSAWQRLSAGAGTNGPRLHDWAYLELAHLEADGYVPGATGLWTRGLLIRRHIADGELAYFTTWCRGAPRSRGHPDRDPRCRRGTPLGDRGRLRDGEDRTRPRPQRDPLLEWLAPPRLAGDARLRHPRGHPPSRERRSRANGTSRESLDRRLVRWSLQEVRRIAARLAQRRIRPALVLAWSAWRRAHQAGAQRAHLKRRPQL